MSDRQRAAENLREAGKLLNGAIELLGKSLENADLVISIEFQASRLEVLESLVRNSSHDPLLPRARREAVCQRRP